jgi:hypothetical protein
MPSLEAGNKTQRETSKSNSTIHNMEHANPTAKSTTWNKQNQQHNPQEETRKSNSTVHNMEHAYPTAQSTTWNT